MTVEPVFSGWTCRWSDRVLVAERDGRRVSVADILVVQGSQGVSIELVDPQVGSVLLTRRVAHARAGRDELEAEVAALGGAVELPATDPRTWERRRKVTTASLARDIFPRLHRFYRNAQSVGAGIISAERNGVAAPHLTEAVVARLGGGMRPDQEATRPDVPVVGPQPSTGSAPLNVVGAPMVSGPSLHTDAVPVPDARATPLLVALDDLARLAGRRAPPRVAAVGHPDRVRARARRPVTVLGIDPGQTGALVWLTGSAARAVQMPATLKVGLDLAAVLHLLEEDRPDRVVLERAQAMPGQGVSSTFSYARDFGGILGLLCALRIPHETVHPSTWHRQLCGARPKGESREQAKARALQVVRQRLPDLDLTPGRKRVPDAGIVDAACLALWGARCR